MSEQDLSCIARLRAGDHRGLEELYDRYAPMLHGLVLRIVGRASDAEEVLQEAWVQAWRQAESYDSSRGTVAAWLLTLARSRAIDRRRSLASRQRAERSAEIEPPPPSHEPAAAAAHHRLREQVRAALAALAPQQRQVLELAYFGGLSQSEIASRLGAPLGTVKSWTRQALRRLRELVAEEDRT
jgi:RNA polymerase sigma-70 factor (ECF subfamily)